MMTKIALILLLLVAAIAATLWKGFAFLKHYRLITGTPTSKIRSAHQGYVEISAHILENEDGPLIAPLSGRQCVWYQYSVARLKSSGKTKTWHIEDSGRSTAWFQVNDGTDTGLIDPTGATIRTQNSRTWYGDTPHPNGSAAAPSGFKLTTFLTQDIGGSRYRYQESLLFSHEKVYALGQFQSVGGGRHLPPLEQISGEVIREWKQSYTELLARFDTDNNQKLDMQEWTNVQNAAHQEAIKRRTEMAATPTMHVLSCPSEKEHPYLISTFDEEKLATRYGWYALGALSLFIGEGYFFFQLILS
ncbi:GIDE domain-containing protein [Neptunomonas sp.]|uniref:GIDE domain-containing protein n=1 Tax=Neptunomonas sp. TaxID=1971898 RepID=UPI0025DE88F8|nr:GIDE domain-containing protein [Neptunomonas sp.]